ncbi:hypothetical protein [Delftia sp. CH05]|uniref:hypothetical protein n=1 Tax=Delftia sp. CH05 TaxID=2692194 RepID=UPI00135E4BE3|nr:hypothetical protein [Delftia sp. CH05]MXN31096.1 hypothetical protein [Delftia sp. CH05]
MNLPFGPIHEAKKKPLYLSTGAFSLKRSTLQRREKMLGYAKSEDSVGWLIDLWDWKPQGRPTMKQRSGQRTQT